MTETAKSRKKITPVNAGVIGSFILLAVFFTVVYLSNYKQPINVINNFVAIWYWIIILSTVFGIQVGLYTYIKRSIRNSGKLTTEVAASGTISAGSMIACCAHNLVSLLPLIGLSAAAIFVVQFQTPIILIGVFSNLTGITIMLSTIKKHKLYKTNEKLSLLSLFNWNKIRNVTIILGLVIITTSFIFVTKKSSDIKNGAKEVRINDYKELSDSANLVTVTVKPINISYEQNLKFEVSFSTHVYKLDFDLTKISELTDDAGNAYNALKWDGDPSGGHHRSGVLEFGLINSNAKSIKLVFNNINSSDRIFQWEIKS